VHLESDGDVMRGGIERHGVNYLSVEARLTEDIPVNGPKTSDRFHFKFMHSADGRGLEFESGNRACAFRDQGPGAQARGGEGDFQTVAS